MIDLNGLMEERLQQFYWNEELSQIDIGGILGCSQKTISNYMIKFGIPRRSGSSMFTPIVREKISEAQKGDKNHFYGKHLSKNHRTKMSEALKGPNNPMYGRTLTKEHKDKLSKALKGQSKPMEHRRRIGEALKGERSPFYGKTGEEHPTWKGGKSFEPYPPAFNEILKRKVRERDNYTCMFCGEEGKQVHHVDYNKENIEMNNLITLCCSCHSKTNKDRMRWKSRLQSIRMPT